MEISEEITIPASRTEIYDALNNIEILRECIPGCESLERKSDTELAAKITLKIGPVKASLDARLILDQTDVPSAYSLVGEGSGLAGFAKGRADVELIEDSENTILKYTAKAETGGKLAQLGSRLMTSTARKLSRMFFEKFEKIMTGELEIKPPE